jgi:hypothetical protein
MTDGGVELSSVKYTDAPTSVPHPATAAPATATPPTASSVGGPSDGKHHVEFHFDPAISPEYFFEARPQPAGTVSCLLLLLLACYATHHTI